jgi:hypothetical protein
MKRTYKPWTSSSLLGTTGLVRLIQLSPSLLPLPVVSLGCLLLTFLSGIPLPSTCSSVLLGRMLVMGHVVVEPVNKELQVGVVEESLKLRTRMG